MAVFSGDKPPPYTDLEGWRQAIADGRLRKLRPESIAAAFQELGEQDLRVREQLAQHLSGTIIGILRNQIDSSNKPNRGEDIIYAVHEVIFVALLQPSSADGRQLRNGFGGIVKFRLKTALAESSNKQIVPAPKSKKRGATPRSLSDGLSGSETESLGPTDETANTFADGKGEDPQEPDEKKPFDTVRGDDRPPPYAPADAEHDDSGPGEKETFDPALMDAVRDMDQMIDIGRIIERIPTFKKRLAYSLHLDGEDQKTIAAACGVSTRTVRTWLDEITKNLKETKEVREITRMNAGGKS
jgi:hypothetical protein